MKTILAVLLVAILLFGCAQQGGGTQAGAGAAAGAGAGTGGTGAGATAGASAGAGATGGTTGATAGASVGVEAGTGTQGAGTETGGTSGAGGVTMDTWSMETLAAMGAPVHCTVTYTGTMTGNYDIYVLGQKSAMTGTFVTAAGTQQEISYIFKDNKMYMSGALYAGMPGFEGCDWISRPIDATATATEQGSVSTETLPASFECVPEIFGEEKFATAGTECDYNTAMASICDQVPAGAARDACLANLGIE